MPSVCCLADFLRPMTVAHPVNLQGVNTDGAATPSPEDLPVQDHNLSPTADSVARAACSPQQSELLPQTPAFGYYQLLHWDKLTTSLHP